MLTARGCYPHPKPQWGRFVTASPVAGDPDERQRDEHEALGELEWKELTPLM